MATRQVGGERERRQNWLLGLVVGGLSLTVLSVGLSYWISATHQAPLEHNLSSPAPDVQQLRSGLTFTRSDGPRPVFTIHAARTVSYQQNNSTELEDVTVEVFGRKGDRSDIMRTQRCQYEPQSGDFLASGPVEIELNAHSSDIPRGGSPDRRKAFLETSKVAYDKDDEVAETDEPVKFRMGSASGTAIGMIYATRDGWIKLKHDVAMELPQGSKQTGEPPIRLTASALRYTKDGGLVALTGPVEVTQGARRSVSDNATVQLDAHNRVSRVNLDGHARAFDANSLHNVELNANHVQGDFDAGSGQLRHLTLNEDVVGESRSTGSISRLNAQRMDMNFAGKRPEPLDGTATGDVHLNLESQPVLGLPENAGAGKTPEKKALTAAGVSFKFRPDTRSLKNAETIGPGTLLVTPSDRKSGEKIITAGQFLMAFDTRSHIESLRGLAPTQVLFRPPATAPAGANTQQTEADRLDATFDAGTQTLREVVQTGNFQYRDGDRQANADDAHYDASTQTLLLLGHPTVWDTESRAKCQKISIDMRTNTSIGEGHVQATHLRSRTPNGSSGSAQSMPLNILADKVVARQQSQTVHYEGHVRAWQGTDVLESSALDVFRTQKRVSSGSQVVTSYLQPAALLSQQRGDPHTGETSPVTVRADLLDYFDQGRRARYHGNVRLVTGSTTIQSDRLDVYFSRAGTAEGSQVDRADADGHVKVTQPGRLGTGDHADYYAGPGKIVLTGGPPVLFDEEKGSTTGQRLTFFTRDDRLLVDGGEKSPSLSQHRVAP